MGIPRKSLNKQSAAPAICSEENLKNEYGGN